MSRNAATAAVAVGLVVVVVAASQLVATAATAAPAASPSSASPRAPSPTAGQRANAARDVLALPALEGSAFAERAARHRAEAASLGARGLPAEGGGSVAAGFGALVEQGWRLGHQEATVELLPEVPGLSVELTVTLEAIDDDVSTFTLRTEVIDLASVELAGEVTATFSFGLQFGQVGVLEVKLHSPLAAGEKITLRAHYSATLDCNKKSTLLRSCTFDAQFSQVMFFRIFFDNAKALHAPHTSTLHVITAGDRAAAAPGNPTAVATLPDGRLVWTFEQPERTENGGIAIADYAQTGDGPGDVAPGTPWLRLMTLKTYAAGAKALLASAADIIAFYSQRFGAFPWQGLSLVQVADNLGGGYAPLSAIFMLRGVFGAKPKAQGWIGWNELTAHEIGHQWWGNLVRPMSGADVSLSESLAEFSSCLYTEQTLGTRSQLVEDNLSYVYTVAAADDRPLGSSAVYSSPAYVPIVYHKGAVVFDMLRLELGEEQMLAGLAALATNFNRDYAKVDDVQAAMEQVSGRDLGWFFEQWWLGKGRIDVEFASQVVARADGGYRLRLRVAQLGAKPLRFKLPLRLTYADGSVEDVEVDVLPPAQGWISMVELDLAQRPLLVRPDAGRRLLRRFSVLDGADVTLDGIVDGMDLVEMAFRYRRTIVWKGGFLPNTAWDELFDGDASFTVDPGDLDLIYARAGETTIAF